MNRPLLILLSLLSGCAASQSNDEYYSLTSNKGWEAKVTPENVANYIPWNQAIDLLLSKSEDISQVAQGHSLEVKIFFSNGDYIGTIEPDIDTIFGILKKCGPKCEHIRRITQ